LGETLSNKVHKTLFAFDCGATNWRLFRLEYQHIQGDVSLLGEPQPSPLTSFNDRKLPAILCLNPEGCALESIGDVAQLNLENEVSREQVREYFKPCIGGNLIENPLPHQKRYTHAQAMIYTRLMLETVLHQIQQEKWQGQQFDDRLWFTFGYPIHWLFDHNGKTLQEYKELVQSCFNEGFNQIRFVPEPEGAILYLKHRELLESGQKSNITLIIDVGGSTTDIIAGEIDSKLGILNYIGRYGGPFGGGLYDSELAKYIADELRVPASALLDDPASSISLRIAGQRLKETLSRQILQGTNYGGTLRRSITLVLRDGTVYRRSIALNEVSFRAITAQLDENFKQLVDSAMEEMNLQSGQINQIVLVGGGVQLFTILSHLRERFGKDRVILADNPDETVVNGLGLEYLASSKKIEPTMLLLAEVPQIEEEYTPQLGSTQWVLEYGGQHYSLQQGITKLGRGEDNDIRLDSLKVSRFHAEISLDRSIMEIIDMGSTNGTFVNGNLIPANQPYVLHQGDEVTIGNVNILVNEQLGEM
jgi:hypothetical protein